MMTTDTAPQRGPYWRDPQQDPDAIAEAREMGHERRGMQDDAPEEG